MTQWIKFRELVEQKATGATEDLAEKKTKRN